VPRLKSLTDDESDVLVELREVGSAVPELYRVLAHSPVLLPSWAGFATAMRAPVAAPGSIRELAILRVAHLVSSDRQWRHHEGPALYAGVTAEALAALTGSRDDAAFTPEEQAVLRLVDEMIGDVEVREATFGAVVGAHGPESTVELVLLVAYYRALAGMLAAFGLR
jgi:alkylhydroperoxidase family enzyme